MARPVWDGPPRLQMRVARGPGGIIPSVPLTPEDVAHVAMLARIGLSDEEQERLRAQLEAILDHIRALDAVGIEGVRETAQVTGLVNVWRKDSARASIGAAAALQNAPETEGQYFAVGAIQE